MSLTARLQTELDQFQRDGVYKRLNYLDSPQAARVVMEGRGNVIILSSNNYLGLCTVPEVIRAGHEALDRFGGGTASVRFILPEPSPRKMPSTTNSSTSCRRSRSISNDRARPMTDRVPRLGGRTCLCSGLS